MLSISPKRSRSHGYSVYKTRSGLAFTTCYVWSPNFWYVQSSSTICSCWAFTGFRLESNQLMRRFIWKRCLEVEHNCLKIQSLQYVELAWSWKLQLSQTTSPCEFTKAHHVALSYTHGGVLTTILPSTSCLASRRKAWFRSSNSITSTNGRTLPATARASSSSICWGVPTDEPTMHRPDAQSESAPRVMTSSREDDGRQALLTFVQHLERTNQQILRNQSNTYERTCIPYQPHCLFVCRHSCHTHYGMCAVAIGESSHRRLNVIAIKV